MDFVICQRFNRKEVFNFVLETYDTIYAKFGILKSLFVCMYILCFTTTVLDGVFKGATYRPRQVSH